MITTNQYDRLLARMTRLENVMNDVLVALDNLVSRTEVQQLLTITQAETADLRIIVDALDDRIESIENEVNL